MQHIIIFFLLALVVQKVDAKCNIYLEPSDQKSKFIEAIHCLNQEIVRLNEAVGTATVIAKRSQIAAQNAAASLKKVEELSSKRDVYLYDIIEKIDKSFNKMIGKNYNSH